MFTDLKICSDNLKSRIVSDLQSDNYYKYFIYNLLIFECFKYSYNSLFEYFFVD